MDLGGLLAYIDIRMGAWDYPRERSLNTKADGEEIEKNKKEFS